MAARRARLTEEPLTPSKEDTQLARQVSWMLAILGGLALIIYVGWRAQGERILASRGIPIEETTIQIPPLPKWIRTDVRKDAVSEGGLTQFSITQPDLTLRVAQAFAMHAWVAGVRRVTKQLPNKVIVDLQYRKPVAMVEIVDPQGNRGLFPIDRDGVFLPPQDFMPDAQPEVKVESYPRIRAEGTYPNGVPGTPWGDVRIHRGALLADYLGRAWSRLGLYLIVAQRGRRHGLDPGNPTFELRTAKNTVILWGHAPGDELAGEATPDKKLSQLADFVQQHGTLDSVAPDQTIDVRHSAGLEVATIGRQLR